MFLFVDMRRPILRASAREAAALVAPHVRIERPQIVHASDLRPENYLYEDNEELAAIARALDNPSTRRLDADNAREIGSERNYYNLQAAP